MNMRVLKVFSVIFFAASAISAQVTSRYTDLDAEKCKTLELEEDEGGVYKGECAGVGGYKLHVLEGDLRQTINVIAPGGKEHELRLWEHFTAFTSVGPRAEWRVKAKKPFALIFRFNVSENPEDSSKTTSYLIVAKVSPNLACVTEIIKPSRKQNAEARRAADRSATVPCKIAE